MPLSVHAHHIAMNHLSLSAAPPASSELAPLARPLPALSELLAASLPASPPPAWLPPSLHPLYIRFSRLPIVEFYTFLYRTSPLLFAGTLFTNWVLPMVLEALPWYLSRRALSKLLRDSKNAIQHRLISADPFPPSSLAAFAAMSLMYSLLHTLEELLRTRLLLLNRLVVRRLVMERILYSEVGSLQQRYALMFGGEKSVLRTEQLEVFVFNDINETLHLFNATIPGLFRSSYTLLLSARELWLQRASIDMLSILRPSIVGFSSELLNVLRERLLLDPQSLALQRNANESSRLISVIVDGLSEIQCNNMQDWAMGRLGALSEEEVTGRQGWTTFTGNMYRVVQGRGVLDFVSEVYVVKAVMERRGITHEQYRKVQNDVDYTTRLVGRIYGLLRESIRILDTQQRVMGVLNLPTFIQEKAQQPQHGEGGGSKRRRHRGRKGRERPLAIEQQLKPREDAAASGEADFCFHDLTVHRLWFRYGPDQPWALKIGERPDGVVDSDERPEDGVNRRDSYDGEPTSSAADAAAASEPSQRSLSSPSSLARAPAPVLRFERGKTYAIIGQNRSGKSTLMEILCKLHPTDPATSPIIAVNAPASSSSSSSSSFASLPRISFRSVLSYIPQRPFIFPGTIEDNVRMGNTRATAADVEAAAAAAGLFLYDQERESKPVDELKTADAALHQWKGDIKRKPWEVDRVGDVLRKTWGWAKAVWQWRWWEAGQQLDDEDEEVFGGGTMEDEMTSCATVRPLRPSLEREVLSSTARLPPPASPSLSVPAQPPLSPLSPASSPSSIHSSSSLASAVAPSSHPVLSLECLEGGSNLSGGFAQSVALSRVFLRPSSELVILDEAMGAMDPIKKVEWIVPRLLEWVRQRGCSLLMVTHDVRLICPLVDCVYVMEHGRLVQCGSHADLMERRAQPYQRMYGEA